MENKALRKYIGKQLQKARKAGGFKSAAAFAEYLGIETSAYTEYEQGRYMFRIDQAWIFADALGISIDELVGYEVQHVHSYSDPDQESLNHYFESMNHNGRATLLNTAKLMSGSPETRIEKDSPECVGISEAVDGVA